ncbi:MAG: beta-ketoacyl-[acyl-carrier-protein] synthase family protein [Desulfovibrio sp.]|jgi:3-oxoacyl-[acyl-carrier-protein] synthase-1/3-oxoacyl-[acyl-carrier-protein] synthase II|nr:beta-ketoacyl-[acyl-carrier-protein] synthase family protein [Desulfovibrio sp.]
MLTTASPVRITGLGCITAAGRTLPECLAALDEGQRLPHLPELFPTDRQFPVFACTLPAACNPLNLPEESGFHAMSRTVHLAAQATAEALADAGLDTADLASARVGVCIGTSVGTSLDVYDYYRCYRNGRKDSLEAIYRYLNSNPAPALARLLGTSGPVQTVTNACSSGTDAIGLAADWIRNGLCDIAVCGGADALCRIIYYGFSSLQLQSTEACMPFDKKRKGLNLGEGAGIVVLESAARMRGRKASGLVRGYGTCADAYHLTAPHPEARGLRAALDHALAQAGAKREAVAFINAHGTATPANDATEGTFFRELFPRTPFISTKGSTGHTLGAAGAVEAVFTLAHLIRGKLPASPGFSEEDPSLGISPLAAPLEIDGRLAMSQSLAFGGNNSILLLGTEEAA